MAARENIAYLLIVAMLAVAVIVPILLRRARKRERRRASQPISLFDKPKSKDAD